MHVYLDLKISECSIERFEEGEAFVRDVRGDGNCLSRWNFFGNLKVFEIEIGTPPHCRKNLIPFSFQDYKCFAPWE